MQFNWLCLLLACGGVDFVSSLELEKKLRSQSQSGRAGGEEVAEIQTRGRNICQHTRMEMKTKRERIDLSMAVFSS